MGIWENFCFICGNSCVPNSEYLTKTQSKFIKKCTLLLPDNSIIHNCKESLNTFYDSKGNDYYYINSKHSSLNDLPTKFCLFLHTDCWKFIKNEYDIKLKYGDIIVKIKKNNDSYPPIDYVNYKPISNYWEQFFNYEQVSNDKNNYILDSQLVKSNVKNI